MRTLVSKSILSENEDLFNQNIVRCCSLNLINVIASDASLLNWRKEDTASCCAKEHGAISMIQHNHANIC